jgi:hypothetical protein
VANACVCSAVETTTASKPPGLSKTRRRSVNVSRPETAVTRLERDLVDVAEHGHVLVRMTGGGAAARGDRELAQAGERTASAGDEGDVELVVQVPAAQEGRRAYDCCGSGDEFTPCQLLTWPLAHSSSLARTPE